MKLRTHDEALRDAIEKKNNIGGDAFIIEIENHYCVRWTLKDYTVYQQYYEFYDTEWRGGAQ